MTRAILIPPLFFIDVKEQLATTQDEEAGRRRAIEDLARQLVEAVRGWDVAAARACSSIALAQSNGERYSGLHDAAVVAVTMELPVGTSTPDRFRCLPTLIREVVANGVRHGAVGALTAAHLCLCH